MKPFTHAAHLPHAARLAIAHLSPGVSVIRGLPPPPSGSTCRENRNRCDWLHGTAVQTQGASSTLVSRHTCFAPSRRTWQRTPLASVCCAFTVPIAPGITKVCWRRAAWRWRGMAKTPHYRAPAAADGAGTDGVGIADIGRCAAPHSRAGRKTEQASRQTVWA